MTVVVCMGERQDWLTRDKVTGAPWSPKLLKKKELQNEDEESWIESAIKGARTNGNNLPNDEGYIIGKIADHSNHDERWMFEVWWDGFWSADDTWE